MVVGVLVELSSKNIDKVFDYKVPDNLASDIKVGIRVVVPFGRMELEGFVLEIKNDSKIDDLKEVIAIKDSDIILNKELLELGEYMHDETLSTLISCYQTMLPKALKAKNGNVINKKYDTFYKLIGDTNNIKLTEPQKKIVELLKQGEVLRKELTDISTSSVNTLLRKGLIEEIKKEHYRLDYKDFKEEKHTLTSEQQNVVDSVNSNDTYLLYGVTGSGKTEVYMELIEKCINKGKTAIVLVPEISLTPQMVNRFRARFGDGIAALHSALSEGEKYDEYRRIYRGEASIVIGARSAIFAPLNNIGIIIIDEEHSESYKQSDPNPRYDAIEIAKWRSKYHNCPLLLGSATPTLESFARSGKGVYKLLELPHRINGKELPKVVVVDMNKEFKKSNGHFSNILIEEIDKRLKVGEQIILLLNRRGYASFVSCKNCGYTFKCPNCDITLTYHKSSNTLRCHYCGHGEKVFTKCPECGEESLNDLGVGTQRIEEELHKIFDCRVLRMDFDTTSGKGKHEEIISSFREGNYDILLGTQIVAKGLDFENVTLVGVINADTSLNIPDFRSSENTFSLLSQVAGRSGRSSREGRVIIQTYNPDHYAIKYASSHDYIGFYKQEMMIRRSLKYPPYYYLCNIKISGKNSEYIFSEALKIKRSMDRNLTNTIILGPSSATIFKLNNIYRYNIILKYKDVTNIRKFLIKVIDHYKGNSKIKIDIDFNPRSM